MPVNGKRPRSLRIRLTYTMLAIATGTLASGGIAAWLALNARAATINQEQKALVIVDTNTRILLTIVRQNTVLQRYLATPNPVFLQQINDDRKIITALISTDISKTTNGSKLGTSAKLVQTSYLKWTNEVTAPAIADVLSSKPTQAIALVTTTPAFFDYQSLLNSINQLSTQVTTDYGVKSQIIRRALDLTILIAVTRVLIVLAALAIIWVLIDRYAIQPIQTLARDVRKVAQGELNKIISAKGTSELVLLGQDIEVMRRRLRDEADELRQLRVALNKRSPLQHIVRSELEPDVETSRVEIAGRVLAADGLLAGDWYDAWNIGEDITIIALVDVSGHGPESGMLALRIKHLMEPAFRMNFSPGKSLTWVAEHLGELEERCATAIGLEINLKHGQVRYANAGHPDLIHRSNGTTTRFGRTGSLICGLGGTWKTHEITVNHQDLIVLVTDGIIEARLPDNTEFGMDRVCEIIERHDPNGSPHVIVEAIVSGLRQICRQPLRDDATVVVIRIDQLYPVQPIAVPKPN